MRSRRISGTQFHGCTMSVEILLVRRGGLSDVGFAFNHKSIKLMLSRVYVQVGQVVYEALSLKIERRVAQDSKACQLSESAEKVVHWLVGSWRHGLQPCGSVHVCDGGQAIGHGVVGVQHMGTVRVAAEPLLGVLLRTYRGDRAELLSLFDLVKTDPRLIVKRSC